MQTSHILKQLTNQLSTKLRPINQENFDYPQTLAPTNKKDSTAYQEFSK